MAEGKKTFIFYSDWINMIKEMPDKDAGELLKHILSYVNDESPTTDNILVKMAFGHMKPMLKADLEKWDEIRGIRKKAGAKGGKANAKQNKANAKQVEAVNVNDNVNDNVNEKDNKIIYPFGSDFLKSWNIWKDYKKEQFSFNYKSHISEQAALKKLTELTQSEPEAIKIIHQSIENGWKGFFERKNNINGSKKRNFTKEGIRDYYKSQQ